MYNSPCHPLTSALNFRKLKVYNSIEAILKYFTCFLESCKVRNIIFNVHKTNNSYIFYLKRRRNEQENDNH
jgi:hypothetical protein